MQSLAFTWAVSWPMLTVMSIIATPCAREDLGHPRGEVEDAGAADRGAAHVDHEDQENDEELRGLG